MKRRRFSRVLAMMCVGALVAACGGDYSVGPNGIQIGEPEVWFGPSPGSRDMIALASDPDQWIQARQMLDTFLFYQGQVDPTVNTSPDSRITYLNENFFPNLARPNPQTGENFFQFWKRNGKKIGIEAGAVKPHNCGQTYTAWESTIRSIEAVRGAGGEVHFVSMDEPFVAGLPPKHPVPTQYTPCGYTEEETAQETAAYMRAVSAIGVQVGLIEAYPYFEVEEIERFIGLLEAQGTKPAYFHLDWDWGHSRNNRELDSQEGAGGDLRRLRDFCDRRGIPFGVILTGNNGTSDATYAEQAYNMAVLYKSIFWGAPRPLKPLAPVVDRVVFESWADHPPTFNINQDGRDAVKEFPHNLPENNPHAHTGIILKSMRLFAVGH